MKERPKNLLYPHCLVTYDDINRIYSTFHRHTHYSGIEGATLSGICQDYPYIYMSGYLTDVPASLLEYHQNAQNLSILEHSDLSVVGENDHHPKVHELFTLGDCTYENIKYLGWQEYYNTFVDTGSGLQKPTATDIQHYGEFQVDDLINLNHCDFIGKNTFLSGIVYVDYQDDSVTPAEVHRHFSFETLPEITLVPTGAKAMYLGEGSKFTDTLLGQKFNLEEMTRDGVLIYDPDYLFKLNQLDTDTFSVKNDFNAPILASTVSKNTSWVEGYSELDFFVSCTVPSNTSVILNITPDSTGFIHNEDYIGSRTIHISILDTNRNILELHDPLDVLIVMFSQNTAGAVAFDTLYSVTVAPNHQSFSITCPKPSDYFIASMRIYRFVFYDSENNQYRIDEQPVNFGWGALQDGVL